MVTKISVISSYSKEFDGHFVIEGGDGVDGRVLTSRADKASPHILFFGPQRINWVRDYENKTLVVLSENAEAEVGPFDQLRVKTDRRGVRTVRGGRIILRGEDEGVMIRESDLFDGLLIRRVRET